MSTTALQQRHFPVDAAVTEWLHQKKTRTGSQRTYDAYHDTMQQFRDFLAKGNLDLLDNPIDIARIAGVWANLREPPRIKKDGTPERRPQGDVSPSTYNQRLAILSSWYTFVQETYQLDIPNPIENVKKRPVQAYAAALPIPAETVEQGLARIDRETLQGLRDYALLSVALATGRRAHELAGLCGKDVRIQGKAEPQIHLTFRCKGKKTMHNLLDKETSAVLFDYLRAQYGEQLLTLTSESPVWVSYSKYTKGQPIGTRTISNICAEYMDTSKVHALRHAFAVGMVRSGAPITDLAHHLGHTDIRITQTYTKEIMGDENPYGEKLVARFGIKRRRIQTP